MCILTGFTKAVVSDRVGSDELEKRKTMYITVWQSLEMTKQWSVIVVIMSKQTLMKTFHMPVAVLSILQRTPHLSPNELLVDYFYPHSILEKNNRPSCQSHDSKP